MRVVCEEFIRRSDKSRRLTCAGDDVQAGLKTLGFIEKIYNARPATIPRLDHVDIRTIARGIIASNVPGSPTR